MGRLLVFRRVTCDVVRVAGLHKTRGKEAQPAIVVGFYRGGLLVKSRHYSMRLEGIEFLGVS